ncbi:MAG: helix-turn-helix domain-containing protein [Sporocytophaga sp.]|uniref:AraC family transcriptional regulator n=1 Tax=Sporocytophaga sp. TaxID=2231183 RepID=UPI001B206810|nr:AraC family transcriptional regulator [Sporocytophaga sp.]MBO9702874.1 helix-turn-helix domain-containing protein [Sporocytophaga sp.]
MKDLPVLTISNFEDYNHCQHCGNSFYIRTFDKHLQDNLFLDKPHGHDFFILLFITNGSGTHSIDFKNYEIKTGSLFLLSPGQVHHWNLSSDINGYILFFTKEYFLLDFNYNKLLTLPFFYTHINSPCMEIKVEDIEQVSNIFKKIDDEYLTKRRFFHDVIRLNLKMLLIELERKYTANQQTPGLMQYQINQLHKLETLIDAHYKEHKQISEYADMMNISLKQLNSLCKKALNKTPGDLLQERLILEAKRLLVYSDKSVSSIAAILNYTDNSYFIRLFRKLTSVTPEQFRTIQLSEYIN